MANNPVQIQNETRIGDGKKLGNTGQKATIGAFGGSAVATVLAYLLVKTGFESDPATAAGIGGALAAIIAPIATAIFAKLAPSSGGVIREVVTHTERPVAEPEGEAVDGVPADAPVAEAPVNGLEDVEPQVAGAPASVAPRHRALGE